LIYIKKLLICYNTVNMSCVFRGVLFCHETSQIAVHYYTFCQRILRIEIGGSFSDFPTND